MDESAHHSLLRVFGDMPDPRGNRTRDHCLHDILTISVCAVLAGLEHWATIADRGEANEDGFGTFLDLPNGIPSHDTFGRVHAALDPDEFETRPQVWIHAVAGSSDGKHIAIDGKTLRRSFDAMHCQPNASEAIVEKNGHSVLMRRGSQPTLHEDVIWAFEDAEEITCDRPDT